MDPQVLVVRDQFALRSLSNSALGKILPTYEQAVQRILAELKMLPAGRLERELRLQQTLAVIQAQLSAVSDRIQVVLPPAQAEAFTQGLTQADTYLRAVGATPVAAATVEGVSATVGGIAVTQQQLVAVARDTGFRTFPGLARAVSGQPYTIGTATAAFQGAQTKLIEARLREGFLTSKATSQIVSDVRVAMDTANRRQVEALVRTSMAQASQTAHDAFNQANEDVLGDKQGNRYIWDASNDGRLCPICAPLDGSRYKQRKQAPWPAHWNERCRILPITALTDELGALPETYLEQTPVQYDAKGRRLPPPKGYDGENAYKQPKRINGELQWVRRRLLQPGKTTAGHMLQKANDDTTLSVLGTKARLERFRKLTAPGGKYANDPQGAVVELLRPGTVKKPAPPPKTPKPKPAPPPAPVAPPPAPPAPAPPPPVQAPPVASRRAPAPTPTPPPVPADATLYSEVRPRKNAATTTDINQVYQAKGKTAVKMWSGSNYGEIRTAQIKAAKAQGARLTDYGESVAQRHLSPDREAKFLRTADNLDEFVTQAPVYKGGTISRGVRYPNEGAFIEDLERLTRGEPALTLESWSSSEAITYGFNGLADRHTYSATFVVEDNLHGVPIASMGKYGRELEVLMPTNVRYEVVHVERQAVTVTSPYGYQPVAEGEFTRVTLRQLPAAPP